MPVEPITILCSSCNKLTLIAHDHCMYCNKLINPVKICEQCGKTNMTSNPLCKPCTLIDPVVQDYKKRMNYLTYSKLSR